MRMNLYARSIVCTAALFLLASSLARAEDDDLIAPDEQVECPPATSDGCGAVPAADGVPVGVFVPSLTPGFTVCAGFLLLKPGADNLGYSTITTFLPLENPQWA